MARISMLGEKGVVGVPSFQGRQVDRYISDLQGPEGILLMAEIQRREPSAFVVQSSINLTGRQSKWSARPATQAAGDVAAADFLESCLSDMSHSLWDSIRFAMSSFAFGFADLEIVFKRRLGDKAGRGHQSRYSDGLIGLRKLGIRRQETVYSWDVDDNGGPRRMIQKHPDTDEELVIPIEKILHFRGGEDRGAWEGLGWLEVAYPLWHMLNSLMIIYGIGQQRSHVGLPVFGYEAIPDETLKREVRNLAVNLVVNEQQYVTYPKSMVEFKLESIQNANAGELRAMINQLRWEITGLGLVQFLRLGSTASGSRALVDPLMDLFKNGVNGLLDDVADIFNRHLVPKLIKVNPSIASGITEMPTIVHSEVRSIPPGVLTYINGIREFIDASDGEDAAWLRSLVGMPALGVDEEEKSAAPEDADDPQPEEVDEPEMATAD